MSSGPKRVLFACVANSARSQMAEALLTSRGGAAFAPASAGVVASNVHPLTIAVLGEWGIDWSSARSKALAPMLERPWDLVVTVCDEAAEACPYIPPPTRVLHWSFEDPAAAGGSQAERLAAFRRVRDRIAAHIDSLIAQEVG
jgi:arsenate reductase (thioredoxin)